MIETVPTQLLIGGDWVDATGGATFEVQNPADASVLTRVADASAGGRRSAPSPPPRRPGRVGAPRAARAGRDAARAFELLTERADEFALLMTLEMGKPLAQSKGEVTYGAEFFRWFSEEAVRIHGRYSPAPDRQRPGCITMKRPVGPTLMITPWNFPLAMGTRKIGPAIAAGCTMVVKPAAETPLTMLALAALLEEVGVPAGVLNVVTTTDSGGVCEPIIKDPRLRKLTFTGSTVVGKKLSRRPPSSCCGCRWSSAATRRSSSSRTPTSTPRSTARCWPRCATSARRAPRPTGSWCTSRSPRSSPAGSPSGWAP